MSVTTLQEENKTILNFDCPKGQSSIIKVIGVGGGGNNAVNHMYKLGIIGVDFVNCNTDLQVLEASPVPHIRFGTVGTGAGSNPEVGRLLAEASKDKIDTMLDKYTQMVFIIAGMGGGTGTGGAPVVAEAAKEKGILTVAIVTEPFEMEGQRRMEQAQKGIEELRKSVDVLLVIKNEKLLEQYGKLKLSEAYHKVDDVMANAAKSIAEIITVRGYVNVDLEDVKTVMRNSGTAIMGIGIAQGENRAELVVEEALNSPLLNNIDIRGSQKLLLYITYGENEIEMDEMRDITELVHERTGNNANLILGHGYDERLGENIAVSIIATGFGMPEKIIPVPPLPKPEYINRPIAPEQPQQPEENNTGKVIHQLDNDVVTENTPPVPLDEMPIPEPIVAAEENEITDETEGSILNMQVIIKEEEPEPEPVFRQSTLQPDIPAPSEVLAAEYARQPMKVFVVGDDDDYYVSEKDDYITNSQTNTTPAATRPAPETSTYPKAEPDVTENLSKHRNDKLRSFSIHPRTPEMSETLMEEPAFRRRNVQFEFADHSSESHASNYNIFPGEDGKPMFLKNQFLHENVD